MNITIIGAGNMGKGIGTRLVTGGHSVTLVDTNPEAVDALADELKKVARVGVKIETDSIESVKPGEIVILAVWYRVNFEVAKQLGSRLENRIVVDIANPLNSTFDDLATKPGSSSAEELVKVLPATAKVVKAFNTTFAGTLVAGNVGGIPLDVFLAGDDEDAKKKVATLITDGGLVPVDTGALHRARQLEGLGMLGITLQMKHNFGFTTGWKLIQPN
jgi:8-hydroxy-5-deazaflavin:NADPH oxidoreductase